MMVLSQIYESFSLDAMKALKAYNTVAINRFHQRNVHNTEVVEIPQDDPPDPLVPDNVPSDLPESFLMMMWCLPATNTSHVTCLRHQV